MQNNAVICRELQINELFELLGEYGDPLPPALFLSGNKGTGKKLCVKRALEELETSGYRHVTLNCREFHSPKSLYETIIAGFTGRKTRCHSSLDFVNELKKVSDVKYEPFLIVLDKAESLYFANKTVMSVFARLRELCDLNICTIFISRLVYGDFFFDMGSPNMITIFFPNYELKEIYNILYESHSSFLEHISKSHNLNDDDIKNVKSPKFFANFLNALLSVFYRNCRDLIELKQRALQNFSMYCEPVIENKISSTDVVKLWRYITPSLKRSLHLSCLYSDPPVYDLLEKENCPRKIIVHSDESCERLQYFIDLPVCAKYLLIAAYLASYNPASMDKRLFMKYHGKQKNTLRQVKSKAKLSEKMTIKTGPKTFTINRLWAIFYSIAEKNYEFNDSLMSELSSLVRWDLVSGSDDIDLDVPKYKCAVGYHFVAEIAKSVNFELKKYLCDFI